jgi:hypothetical protein
MTRNRPPFVRGRDGGAILASAGARLAIAAVASALLWAAFVWATA